MKFISVSGTSLRVSSLCFGTMTFGDGADERTCKKMYSDCREAGINMFDSANVYAGGESERILGRLIRGHRHEVVITTKCYYPMRGDESTRGSSPRKLDVALSASLGRLGVDFVDIFYLHSFDGGTPLEESLGALNGFVRDGKVRHIGVSNFAAWQVMKALAISETRELEAVTCIQPMYNLLKRQCESELLPMAASEGLAVFPYGPVAGGYLTGKYLDSDSACGRFSGSEEYRARYSEDVNEHSARRFVEFARRIGKHPASLAIAWVAAHPDVTAPIIGARDTKQLSTSLDALNIEISRELRREISALTPAPALATDRSEERPGA